MSNRTSTHWEGCWKHHGHSKCAQAKVAELKRRIEERGLLLGKIHADLKRRAEDGVVPMSHSVWDALCTILEAGDE